MAVPGLGVIRFCFHKVRCGGTNGKRLWHRQHDRIEAFLSLQIGEGEKICLRCLPYTAYIAASPCGVGLRTELFKPDYAQVN